MIGTTNGGTTRAEIYRQKAESMRAQATRAESAVLRECYLELAEQWDTLSKMGETRPRKIAIAAILH